MAAAHVMAGATLGTACNRTWWVAVPVAFVSHFVLDQIPHTCLTILGAETGSEIVRGLAIAGRVADPIIVAGIVAMAWRLHNRWVVLAAGLAAFAPDPLNYTAPITEWFAMLPGAWLLPWTHRTFHCDVTRTQPLLGLLTQLVVLAAGVWVMRRAARAHTKPVA